MDFLFGLSFTHRPEGIGGSYPLVLSSGFHLPFRRPRHPRRSRRHPAASSSSLPSVRAPLLSRRRQAEDTSAAVFTRKLVSLRRPPASISDHARRLRAPCRASPPAGELPLSPPPQGAPSSSPPWLPSPQGTSERGKPNTCSKQNVQYHFVILMRTNNSTSDEIQTSEPRSHAWFQQTASR